MRPLFAIPILVSVACVGAQTKPPSSPETFDEIARKADAARNEDRLEDAARLYQRALRIKPAWASAAAPWLLACGGLAIRLPAVVARLRSWANARTVCPCRTLLTAQVPLPPWIGYD